MFLAVYDSSVKITQILDHEARCCLGTSGLPMTFFQKNLQLVSSCLTCPSCADPKKDKIGCPAVASHPEMQHAAELASQQSSTR